MLRSLMQCLSLAAPAVVIPAKAGIQSSTLASNGHFWMPAFAGMTPGLHRHQAGVRVCPYEGRGCVTHYINRRKAQPASNYASLRHALDLHRNDV